MFKIQVKNLKNKDFFNKKLLIEIYESKEKAIEEKEITKKLLNLKEIEIEIKEDKANTERLKNERQENV